MPTHLPAAWLDLVLQVSAPPIAIPSLWAQPALNFPARGAECDQQTPVPAWRPSPAPASPCRSPARQALDWGTGLLKVEDTIPQLLLLSLEQLKRGPGGPAQGPPTLKNHS